MGFSFGLLYWAKNQCNASKISENHVDEDHG